MTQTRRKNWIDGAKGIGILLVVIGHAWRGLHSGGLVPSTLFHVIDSRIYAFHMPLFFTLSGMFLARSLAAKPAHVFLGDRLRRLFWPMVLWTYLFLGVKLLAGSAANTPVTAHDILVWPVPGYLHLWFLWALFLQHIAMLGTRRILEDGAFSTTALATMSGVALAAALFPWPTALTYWIGPALRYAPFLVLGLWLGRAMQAEKGPAIFGSAMRIAALLVFLGLLFAWQDLPNSLALKMTGSLVLTFCLLAVISGLKLPEWVAFLGASSMAIYLCHTIFSAACRTALIALGITNLPAHMILATLAGVLGSLVVLWVSRKLGLNRVLGF